MVFDDSVVPSFKRSSGFDNFEYPVIFRSLHSAFSCGIVSLTKFDGRTPVVSILESCDTVRYCGELGRLFNSLHNASTT